MIEQEDSGDFIDAIIAEVEDHIKLAHWEVTYRNNVTTGLKTVCSVGYFKRKILPRRIIFNHKA